MAKNGTSHSSPLVAGAIALLWSGDEDCKNNVLKTIKILHSSTRKIETEECSQEKYPNHVYGYGIIDALLMFERP
jgi:subtilisin family serine protease